MCGIVGYVGGREAAPILIDGLKRLEYRGYDSAGIAILEGNGRLSVHKREGKLDVLSSALSRNWPQGHQGVGHTRWATHGRPSDLNAHPHTDCKENVVVIHNGIVENHQALRRRLLASGHTFRSETDSEVIAHLIEEKLDGRGLEKATAETVQELVGAHAILVMSACEPGVLVAGRVGNAGGVVVGYGEGENFLASDLPALLPHSRRLVFLEEGDIARVTAEDVSYTRQGRKIEREPQEVVYDPVSVAKGSYKHFMLKEIMEQPETLLNTLRGRALFGESKVVLEDIKWGPEQVAGIQRAVLIGMGTSLHAAMIGRHYIERIAGIPAEVDNASELRYRSPLIGPETLVISVTQSGETVDTLAAMEEARSKGCLQVTICNVLGSEASRVASGGVFTRCGPEIGVASTKTFTAAIAALYLLACYLGQERRAIGAKRMEELLRPLARLPYLTGEVVKRAPEYERLAHTLIRYQNFLYLGRGFQYPVAMEGALKLKEVSYIHAEGYPAGEMKHGPIALIDEEMPVVALAPRDDLRDKMMSNIEQVKARNGKVVAVGTEGDRELAEHADYWLEVPALSPFLTPVLTSIPLQLFAYYIALLRGCDVDQPRNLAKTVTVE